MKRLFIAITLLCLLSLVASDEPEIEQCLSYGWVQGKKLCNLCFNSLVDTEKAGCLPMPESYNCVISEYSDTFGPQCSVCKADYYLSGNSENIATQCVKAEREIENCYYQISQADRKGCYVCANYTWPSEDYSMCMGGGSPRLPHCKWTRRRRNNVLKCFQCEEGYYMDYGRTGDVGKCIRYGRNYGCSSKDSWGSCSVCSGWNGFYMNRSGKCNKRSQMVELFD